MFEYCMSLIVNIVGVIYSNTVQNFYIYITINLCTYIKILYTSRVLMRFR